jgi:nucleoside-diphosphate kinase
MEYERSTIDKQENINILSVMNRTQIIIKPDAVKRNLIGIILKQIVDAGFKIIGMKMVWLTKEQGGKFYEIHKGKDFYNWLVDFISSGPIVVCCLQFPNAAAKLREVVGATDPKKAAHGTVRNLYGTSVGENVVHASAPDEDPHREIQFFFTEEELFDHS